MASSGSSSEKSPKMTRGPTLMRELLSLRYLDVRLAVEFNANISLGKNGEKLESYIGCVAHEKVPISISNLHSAPKELKNKLCDDILIKIFYNYNF